MHPPTVGNRRTHSTTRPPSRRPALLAPARDTLTHARDPFDEVRVRGTQETDPARFSKSTCFDGTSLQTEPGHPRWDSPADKASCLRIARDPGRHVLPTCADFEPSNSLVLEEKPRYQPLSRTTEHVLRMLLDGDLSRVRAESVAEALGISCTTLRRRLRQDHTSYQFLLDRARQFRCEKRLRERWLPGKCLADELGYLEINSFYRAFKRWTGLNYSEYRESFL
ncbi:MAG: AraC family transcriptional regulator [Pseudomonadota bacterium]